ncbi:DciA family protein [Streptomyces sp. NPDC127084]|uniref:DciA family protein n=1 Tax=Streptomyces sp. NPDC127084 TaxID=3347133 RepID=UPI003653237D
MRWATIAPELAEHVAAVAFDADPGQLTVRPESMAWAAKTRLEQALVIEAANTQAGRMVVRTLRILPPSTLPADAESAAAVAPSGPPRTRQQM